MRDMGKLLSALFDEQHNMKEEITNAGKQVSEAVLAIEATKLNDDTIPDQDENPENVEKIDAKKNFKESLKGHIGAAVQNQDKLQNEDGIEKEVEEKEEPGTSGWFEMKRGNKFFHKAANLVGEPLLMPGKQEDSLSQTASKLDDAIRSETPETIHDKLAPPGQKKSMPLSSTDPNLQ